MVVKMQDGMCILLPDTHQGELKVFARDLTEAQDSGTGALQDSNSWVGLNWGGRGAGIIGLATAGWLADL